MTQATSTSDKAATSLQHTPVLSTKLVPSPARSVLVVRSRLLQRLDEALSKQLTLIAAPPGFGKTTLLSAWVERPAARCAWLSLDEGDNAPTRFWQYVVAALEPHAPSSAPIAGLRHSFPSLPLDAVLTALLNSFTDQSEHVVLVLDDYHTITEAAIHETLARLIERLPPRLHVVIASRSDPPLPLARWRVRAHLVELREHDLRFTPAEAAAFFNDVMGLALAPAALHTLEQRTEGWIAGLQLAALSLQGRSDPEQFIETFSGNNRYILEYLVEEVLMQQPAYIRRFLLETAILDRFSAALCAAVTGQQDAQEIVVFLERANMFVIPLDNERVWYRYHHLFADVLRTHLGREAAEYVNELHLRASAWYAREGLTTEAIKHATAARDWERAAQLIEQFGGPLLASGEWTTLLGWLNLLPDTTLRERLQLSLYHAWALALTGQAQLVEAWLHDIEQRLCITERDETARPPSTSLNAWRGQIAAIRGYNAAQRGDIASAITSSREALARLPEHDLIIRGVIALSLGTIYLNIGHVVEAEPLLLEARRASEAGGNWATALSAAGMLAQVREEQGDLQRAATLYREIKEHSAAHIHMALHAHLHLGLILYEWNDLAGALQALERAATLAQQIAAPDMLTLVGVALARARWATGELAVVHDLLQQVAEQQRASQPLITAYSAAQIARLHLLLGDTDAAVRWADSYTREQAIEHGLIREFADLTLVRVQLAGGIPQPALDLLQSLMPTVEAQGRIARHIEILALHALALNALQMRAAAQEALRYALTLAAPHGYVRTLLDEGAQMRALLAASSQLPSAVSLQPYSQRLLTAFPVAPIQHPTSQIQQLIEPLSERELEILRLLAAGRSNQEIATALIVAVGTVKKHINNIYGKLGVHSRTQALARARELNLL